MAVCGGALLRLFLVVLRHFARKVKAEKRDGLTEARFQRGHWHVKIKSQLRRITSMNAPRFQRVKVIALPVADPNRANKFYETVLGLPPAYEGGEQVGYSLGDITLMLKSGWYASPTQSPNPRITIETNDAVQMERALREKGVVISDPLEVYDEFYVGSFLDSEETSSGVRAGERTRAPKDRRSARKGEGYLKMGSRAGGGRERAPTPTAARAFVRAWPGEKKTAVSTAFATSMAMIETTTELVVDCQRLRPRR